MRRDFAREAGHQLPQPCKAGAERDRPANCHWPRFCVNPAADRARADKCPKQERDAEDPAVKAQIVLLTALALLGCTSPDSGIRDLALRGTADPGAREALQQQPDSPNCRAKAHRGPARLADAADALITTAAFDFAGPSGAAWNYAQLDDPTKDWTREQATGSPSQCPPTGRKHRYFA